MNRTVLLVSTASVWLGTARMVRGLARAGFEVVLFAPEGSLATHSRYVTRRHLLPRDASPGVFLLALSQVVAAHPPALAIPCDEMALRLLFTLVLSPPPSLPAATHFELDALIRRSLGDPAHYLATVDKLLLPAAAAAAGIAMPPSAVVETTQDAQDFAATQGYPIVLKRRYGFAGEGVRIVAAASELAEAFTRLSSPDQLDIGQPMGRQLLAQAFITGAYHSQALVAWQGATLAAFGWERFVATQPIKGQTAVIRLIDSPATRAAAEEAGRAFGITGFFNVQFVLEAGGAPLMLEVNRRLVTHTHFGERAGVDLPAALYSQLTGAPAMLASTPRGPDTIAVFPREWLRDPQSAHLSHGPVDLPWDEPELIEALLALRRAS